ncbi:MAG TPA: 4-alpha-glucanotransferase [Dissulfurispiraceae bacterium]|nr:4-alpha-glucanotransferase [Dissulfurispiraceae bacterium]
MPECNELILELADLCGIIPDYWDILGTRHWASPETKKAILRAMRINVDSVECLQREIAEQKGRPWNRLLEPVRVISVTAQPVAIPLCIPLEEGLERSLTISWTIRDELGHACSCILPGEEIIPAASAVIGGVRFVRILLPDSGARRIGYYDVQVVCRHAQPVFSGGASEVSGVMRLIITPDECYIPPEIVSGRTWGVSANLYAVRSGRNQGIGDFADLETLVRLAGECGGGFVGINPLHAIPNTYPYGISPYSPVSRIYKNHLYLALEAIAEVQESEACRNLTGSDNYRKQEKAIRNADTLDYEAVAALKEQVLRCAFQWFYEHHWQLRSERAQRFRDYMQAEGESLSAFATWCAMRDHFCAAQQSDAWQHWPEQYHTPQSDAVTAFRKEHEISILYYQYLQWLLHEQHKNAAALTQQLHMPVGLYHDLAVGSIAGGSDAWMAQEVFAHGISVGAPLDDFNPSGQDWGFPPMIPEQLRETGYRFFIESIRSNMCHGGAIRIDHALGLFRLFWIPDGKLPLEGAYVRCFTEELLRIIALESVRNKTIVVGEDLGTFSDGMREMLQSFRMLSFRLLYFERYYPDPNFKRPEHYPDMAIAAVTTHDLPTLAGFWLGRDIDVKEQLHLFPHPENISRHREERRTDRTLLVRALKEQGLLPPGFPEAPDDLPVMTPEIALAAHAYLARSPSKMLSVMLDDLMGLESQQNLPGTVNQHPNWVQKTAWRLEDVRERSWLYAFAGASRQNGR